MNEKNYLEFNDKNNHDVKVYLSRSAKLCFLNKKLNKSIDEKISYRKIVGIKQEIKKLQNPNSDYNKLFLRDFFKRDYEILFISECIPLLEILLNKKSVPTAKRHLRSLRRFIIYLRTIEKSIYSLSEITKEFIIRFHGDVLNSNNFEKDANYESRRFVYSIISNLLKKYWYIKKSGNYKMLSLPAKKRDSKKAYSIEFSKLLFAICISEINDITKKFNKYENWKKEFKNKEFYSLNNLCFTYRISKGIRGYGLRLKYLNKVAKLKYDIELSTFSDKKLKVESMYGIDITNFDTEQKIAWFIESEISDFPYKSYKISDYKNYFPLGESVSAFFYKYGQDVHNKFKKVLECKLPFSDNIYPFYLLTLLTTGLNVDTLNSWKYKEDYIIGEEKYPLDSNFIMIWGLKKKTNKYIMTVLDTKDKNGLWKYIKFLKKYLYMMHKTSNDFWVFSSKRDYKSSSINTYSLKRLSKEFCKKYKSFFDERKTEYIEHQRLRPTKVAIELMKGKSLESIKESILNHSNIDTSFHYTNSSEYKDFIDINTCSIQESLLIEAENFKGQFNGEISKVKPAYTNYCNDRSINECFNYDNCLLCEHSRVFPEHIALISETIEFYQDEVSRMNTETWTLLYGKLYDAALDCLERFINQSIEKDSVEIRIAKKTLLNVGTDYESA